MLSFRGKLGLDDSRLIISGLLQYVKALVKVVLAIEKIGN